MIVCVCVLKHSTSLWNIILLLHEDSLQMERGLHNHHNHFLSHGFFRGKYLVLLFLFFLSWKYYPALSKVTNKYLGDSETKSTSDPSRILESWVSDLILAAHSVSHSSKALPLLFPQHLFLSHGLSVLLMSY